MSLLKARSNRAGNSRRENRVYPRYKLPLSVLVEARWEDTVLSLQHAPDHENISAQGLLLCLAGSPPPPVNAELDIRFPLVERPTLPGRAYAHCRGRVVRIDAPNRVAVHLEDVGFEYGEIAGAAASPALIRS